jgi:hypothetical protein
MVGIILVHEQPAGNLRSPLRYADARNPHQTAHANASIAPTSHAIGGPMSNRICSVFTKLTVASIFLVAAAAAGCASSPPGGGRR